MKIELILSDEQVRLMLDVLNANSAEIHETCKKCLTLLADANSKKYTESKLDDLDRAYRQATLLDTVANMIREQYAANRR